MTRSYAVLITVLGAIWGSSYLFIKVAVADLPPSVLTASRTLLAGTLLVGILAVRRGLRQTSADLRAAWLPVLLLAIANNAVPYWLIAWGERHVDSGTAAIANATVPIFTALLAIRWAPAERVRGLRLAGLGIGLAGVGVLVGASPTGWLAVAGTMAVVVASLCYAGASLYAGVAVRRIEGPVLAAGSVLVAGVLMAPIALVQLPSSAPSAKSIGAMVALALLGTAAAQLLMYRILRLHGASRMILVTYLIPAFALLYGAVVLDEPVTGAELGGMALILLGVALGSGRLLEALRRRRAVAGPAG